MTQLICLIALNVLLNKTKNLNVDINLSTTEHAFTKSFEQCIIYCCEYNTMKTLLSAKTNTSLTSSESQRANWRDKNWDSFLPSVLPNDVMFKSDDSVHLSYRFEYFVEKK